MTSTEPESIGPEALEREKRDFAVGGEGVAVEIEDNDGRGM